MNKKKKRHLLIMLVMALLLTGLLGTNVFAASKTAPGKVTLSKVSSYAYNKVTIKWKKTTNADKYVIYYKKSGASKWTKLTSVASSKTSYTHTSSKKYPIVVGQKYHTQ